ncbi:MAG: preprotein translocase subunit SecA, partial [Cytophagales bacterium]
YASITLQNYFRMYEKLSGMTGTAETESEEFFELYGLDVVIAPTNKPNIRDDKADKIFKTIKEKFDYILREIIDLSNEKRPILVGTTSIESSELISKMLSLKKVNHRVLNAKQHKKEANIISSAGFEGLITIATNMAGRGTDIKLSKNSRLNGGLAVIGTERHESRRIDNQLRGRSGRQGDVGSSQFFISLEDNLMRLFGSDKIAGLMDKIGLKEGDVIQHSIVNKSIERAQKKIEENNFFTRRRLLDYDNVVNYQRKFIYQRRKNSLFSEKLYFDILYIIFDISDFILFKKKKKVNYSYFKSSMLSYFKILTKIKLSSFLKNSNF